MHLSWRPLQRMVEWVGVEDVGVNRAASRKFIRRHPESTCFQTTFSQWYKLLYFKLHLWARCSHAALHKLHWLNLRWVLWLLVQLWHDLPHIPQNIPAKQGQHDSIVASSIQERFEHELLLKWHCYEYLYFSSVMHASDQFFDLLLRQLPYMKIVNRFNMRYLVGSQRLRELKGIHKRSVNLLWCCPSRCAWEKLPKVFYSSWELTKSSQAANLWCDFPQLSGIALPNMTKLMNIEMAGSA